MDGTVKGSRGGSKGSRGVQEEGEIKDKGNEQGGKKRPTEPF